MTNKKYIKSLFIRVLASIVLFLAISVYINYSDKNLLFFKKHFYDQSFNFSGFNKLYQKYFGKVIPQNNIMQVNRNNFSYTSYHAYHDGAELIGVNTVMPFKSGIVVYVGQKENYGDTIIIQGMDGIDYWYGNVTDIAVKLYDYIESDNIIANAKDSKLYIAFIKSGEVLDFEEYI